MFAVGFGGDLLDKLDGSVAVLFQMAIRSGPMTTSLAIRSGDPQCPPCLRPSRYPSTRIVEGSSFWTIAQVKDPCGHC